MNDGLRTRFKTAFRESIEGPSPRLAQDVFAAIPIGLSAAPGIAGLLHRVISYIARHWLTATLIAVGGAAALGYVIINRTPDVGVYVAYADHQPERPGLLPNPWQGAANTRFIGTGPSFDAGAIRIDNRTDGEVTVDHVSVDIGGKHYELWGSGIHLAAHQSLILTQTRIIQANPFETNFDTSEALGQGCKAVTRTVPIVHVTVNGHRLDFQDRNLVLTTGGRDLGNCPGKPAESHAWEQVTQ